MGITFWIAGVPGSADEVNVKAPSTTAAGIKRCGMSAWQNRASATGTIAKATTKRLTPP